MTWCKMVEDVIFGFDFGISKSTRFHPCGTFDRLIGPECQRRRIIRTVEVRAEGGGESLDWPINRLAQKNEIIFVTSVGYLRQSKPSHTMPPFPCNEYLHFHCTMAHWVSARRAQSVAAATAFDWQHFVPSSQSDSLLPSSSTATATSSFLVVVEKQ